MRFIHTRVARIRELKGPNNIFAPRPPCCGDIRLPAPARKHQKHRSSLSQNKVQSVSETISQLQPTNLYAGVVAYTKLQAQLEQCRRALQHPSSQYSSRNRTQSDYFALASLSHPHYREHSSTKVPRPRHHPPPTTPPSTTLILETTC